MESEPLVARDARTSSPDAAWFQLLVEQIHEFAIFLISPDGRNVSWNPGVGRVLGFTPAEFVGQSVAQIFTPEDTALGVPTMELETARAAGAASDDRWMMRRDGTRFWASGVTTSLRDESGALLGFSKVLRDLTDQKVLQDRLLESEERLRVALAAAGVGTWRWNLATGTDTLDASLARLLGFGDGDTVVTLEQFFAKLHPDDQARTRAAFHDAVTRGGGLDVEFRVVRPDGTVRWLRDHGEVILDPQGAPVYLTGAVVDITEQREMDERVRHSQRLDAVGKLAGGVAHEVNNMMSVVLGFTDFLLADFEPGDRRRVDLEQVRAAAGRAATVTAQLLAFSRQQMLKPAVIRLDQIVDGLAPVLQRLLGADRELTIRHAPDTGHVRADRGQLEQVIVNLALNARDAMGPGGRLTLETRPGPGPSVVLAVSDTGHGMDRATRERVFEPFFTTKPTGQGSGLGLAVVHGIIHQSDGEITVESEPGVGTTFRVVLPVVTGTDEQTPARPAAGARARFGQTVLVVEDEPMVRTLVVRMLDRLGYTALEAGDGTDALETVQAHPSAIDIVVSDIVMPRMNGRELAERLASVRPGLPVLFMSGYTDDEMVRRDLLAPNAPFIQKPFELAPFAEKLEELLEGARSLDHRSR